MLDFYRPSTQHVNMVEVTHTANKKKVSSRNDMQVTTNRVLRKIKERLMKLFRENYV